LFASNDRRGRSLMGALFQSLTIFHDDVVSCVRRAGRREVPHLTPVLHPV